MSQRNRIELLVMGARPESLGEAIVDYALQIGWDDNDVISVGVTEHEDFPLNILDHDGVSHFFLEHDVRHVVCTVGVNYSCNMGSADIGSAMSQHLLTNTVGVANALQCWKTALMHHADEHQSRRPVHFAAVSSNSAHIARRTSAPYCASKAALSMVLRVAAREWALDNVCVYGWEPGLIEDTPMTHMVNGHRIPSGDPIKKDHLAKLIVETLNAGVEVNGCLFRVDGGEQ